MHGICVFIDFYQVTGVKEGVLGWRLLSVHHNILLLCDWFLVGCMFLEFIHSLKAIQFVSI